MNIITAISLRFYNQKTGIIEKFGDKLYKANHHRSREKGQVVSLTCTVKYSFGK